jgi:hypothetical protein
MNSKQNIDLKMPYILTMTTWLLTFCSRRTIPPYKIVRFGPWI